MATQRDPSAEGDPRSGGKPALLAGSRPSEILDRLLEDDRLELWPRTLAAIREHGWLLEPEALYLRFATCAAVRAPGWNGAGGVHAWLEERLHEAAGDLIDEDERAEFEGIPPQEPLEPRLALVAGLGVEPASTRQAILRFHELPLRTRRVFFLVALEHREIGAAAKELGCTLDEAERALFEALTTLSLRNDPLGAEDPYGESEFEGGNER